jgi:hypothetical protein
LQGFCNNAGIYHQSDWRLVVDTNLVGMLTGSLLAVEKMGVRLFDAVWKSDPKMAV